MIIESAIMMALVSAGLGGLISPMLLKLADHFLNRNSLQFDQEAAFRNELWKEVGALRERVTLLDKRNDDLVQENATLSGQMAGQAAQIEMLIVERDALKVRVRELENKLSAI